MPRKMKKTEKIVICLSLEEKALIQKAASAAGYPLSNWANVQILTGARKVLGIPPPTAATNGGGA